MSQDSLRTTGSAENIVSAQDVDTSSSTPVVSIDRLTSDVENLKKQYQEIIMDLETRERRSEKRESWMLWLVGGIAVVFLLSFAAIVIDYHHNTLVEEERNYDLLKQNIDGQKNIPSNPSYKKLEIDF